MHIRLLKGWRTRPKGVSWLSGCGSCGLNMAKVVPWQSWHHYKMFAASCVASKGPVPSVFSLAVLFACAISVLNNFCECSTSSIIVNWMRQALQIRVQCNIFVPAATSKYYNRITFQRKENKHPYWTSPTKAIIRPSCVSLDGK